MATRSASGASRSGSARSRLARLAALVAALAVAGIAFAQSREGAFDFRKVERVYLDDVHAGPGGERVVDLYVRALTGSGAPVTGLRPADVEVSLDGTRIPVAEVELQPLAATSRGFATVIALDASGTMRGEPFEHAKQGALAFLERLQPEDRVAVLTFAEDVREVAGFDLARPETREVVRALAVDLERGQRTLLHDGTHQAITLLRRHPGLPRRSLVLLFSDGTYSGSQKSREEVLAAAKGGDTDAQVSLFAIGYARFGTGGMDELRKLADGTGGEFLQATSMLDLREFFDAIAVQVLQSYLIRFPAELDGQPHQARVGVEKQSAERRARFPYVARPLWPWLAAGAAAVAMALGTALLLRMRGAGRLRVVSGPVVATEFRLRGPRMTIGALETCDVVLQTPAVSRHHADLVVRGRRVEIRDRNSTNGIRVNGRPVDVAALQPGDQIRLGDVELVYER